MVIPFRFFDDTVRFRAVCDNISDYKSLSRKQYYKEVEPDKITKVKLGNGLCNEEEFSLNYKFQFNLPRGCMFPTTGGSFPACFVEQGSFGVSVQSTEVADFLLQKATQRTCSLLEETYAKTFDKWWQEAALPSATGRGASSASKAMKNAMTSKGASTVTSTVKKLFKGWYLGFSV